MLFDELNSDNFVLYASRHYDNPGCTSADEFYQDLDRIKYIKRLFYRYDNGDLQVRLILNHIIVIFNVFGIEAANRMLLFKIEERHYPVLKAFLVYLNYIKDEDIGVEPDYDIMNRLRKL